MQRLSGTFAPKATTIALNEKQQANTRRVDVVFVVGPRTEFEKSELIKAAAEHNLNYLVVGDGTSVTLAEIRLELKKAGVGPDTHIVVTGHGALTKNGKKTTHRTFNWETRELISTLASIVGEPTGQPRKGIFHFSSCDIESLMQECAPGDPIWRGTPSMLHGGPSANTVHNSLENLKAVIADLGQAKKDGAALPEPTTIFDRIAKIAGDSIRLLGTDQPDLRHDPLDRFEALLQAVGDANASSRPLLDAPSASALSLSRRKLENIFFSLLHRADVARVRAALATDPRLTKLSGAQDMRPLHIAAGLQRASAAAELTQLLLDHGAQIDAPDNLGNAPLQYACLHKNAKVAMLLLSHGANANLANKDGETPLHCACQNGEPVTIMLLLKALVDVNAATNRGVTPLIMACANGNFEAAKLLLMTPSTDYDMANVGGDTALHYACENVSVPLTQLLAPIASDSLLHRNSKGLTPFDIALKHGDREIITVLVACGAADQIRGEHNATLLHQAAAHSNEWLCEALIKRSGHDVHARTDQGQTPLHCACATGSSRAAIALIAAGAQLDARDSRGMTPLASACAAGDGDTISLLLKSGANASTKDRLRRTLIHHASRRVGDGLAILLRLPIMSKESLDAEDDSGRTPLMYAAERGHCEFVEFLIENGASWSKVDNDGNTATRLVETALRDALGDRQLFGALTWIKTRLAKASHKM